MIPTVIFTVSKLQFNILLSSGWTGWLCEVTSCVDLKHGAMGLWDEDEHDERSATGCPVVVLTDDHLPMTWCSDVFGDKLAWIW